MMFLNWGVEAYKWRYLVCKIQKITFFNSVKSIFIGITFSAFTPNKIGEFGGRLIYLNKGNKIKGVLITLVTSFAQLLTTITFGTISLVFTFFFLNDIFQKIQIFDFSNYFILFTLIILNLLLTFFYFYSTFFSKILFKISFLKRFQKYTDALLTFNKIDLLKVFMFGCIRYIIFLSQFIFLLEVLEAEIILTHSITLIPLVYLLTSLFPIFAPIADISFRLFSAFLILGIVSDNFLAISLAIFFIWVINFVFPLLIGLLFTFNKYYKLS